MTTFLNWHVLAVRGGSEQSALEALVEKKFEVFLPMYKRLKAPSRHARGRAAKRIIVEQPLFYGYLFANLETEALSTAIRIRHVHSLLKVNDQPVVITEKVIEEIRHRCAMGVHDEVQEIQLYAGDQVILSSGPGAGFVGRVVRQPSSEHRVDVEINGLKVVSALANLRKLCDQINKGDGGSACIQPLDERHTDPADPNRGFSPLTKSASKSSKKFMSG